MKSIYNEYANSLAKLKGPQTIEAIVDHFVSQGLLQPPDDVVRQWQIKEARRIVSYLRRADLDTEEVQGRLEWVLLPNRSGETQQCFKFVEEMTKKEAVEFCTDRYHRWEAKAAESERRARSARKELIHYVDVFTSTFGKSFQKMLPFTLPKLDEGKGASGK